MSSKILFDPQNPGLDGRITNRIELINASRSLDLQELVPGDELMIEFASGSKLFLGSIWEMGEEGLTQSHRYKILGIENGKSTNAPFFNQKIETRIGDEIGIHGSGLGPITTQSLVQFQPLFFNNVYRPLPGTDWYATELKQDRFIDGDGIVHWKEEDIPGMGGKPIYANNFTEEMAHATLIRNEQENSVF